MMSECEGVHLIHIVQGVKSNSFSCLTSTKRTWSYARQHSSYMTQQTIYMNLAFHNADTKAIPPAFTPAPIPVMRGIHTSFFFNSSYVLSLPHSSQLLRSAWAITVFIASPTILYIPIAKRTCFMSRARADEPYFICFIANHVHGKRTRTSVARPPVRGNKNQFPFGLHDVWASLLSPPPR